LEKGHEACSWFLFHLDVTAISSTNAILGSMIDFLDGDQAKREVGDPTLYESAALDELTLHRLGWELPSFLLAEYNLVTLRDGFRDERGAC